jgi:hypothetical protein
MIAHRSFPTWVLALVLGLATLPSPAPAVVPDSSAVPLAVTLGPGSTLWLEGTSTLHDYESRTSETAIAMIRDPAAPQPSDAAAFEALIRASGVRGVDVRVPVLSLRSKKSGLDRNLWRTLQADAHPAIHCQIDRATVTSSATGGDTLGIRAEGTLEVAGRTRPITLEARAWRAASGIWISGSTPLLMSDFGIKPPTMMMGTLRVANRVTVHYRLLLTPENGGKGSPPADAHEKGAER